MASDIIIAQPPLKNPPLAYAFVGVSVNNTTAGQRQQQQVQSQLGQKPNKICINKHTHNTHTHIAAKGHWPCEKCVRVWLLLVELLDCLEKLLARLCHWVFHLPRPHSTFQPFTLFAETQQFSPIFPPLLLAPKTDKQKLSPSCVGAFLPT